MDQNPTLGILCICTYLDNVLIFHTFWKLPKQGIVVVVVVVVVTGPAHMHDDTI